MKAVRLLLTIFLALAMLSIFGYLGVRTMLYFSAQYGVFEKITAAFLLFAEGFTMLHAFGYFLNIFHVMTTPKQSRLSTNAVPELHDYPPIAVIVSSFHEPIEVVEDTLICFYNMTYPNKHIYFLDDTRYDRPNADPQEMAAYRAEVDAMCQRIGVNLFRRRWRGAKAGMINDFLDFIQGKIREGFEFQSFEDTARTEREKYILVFDADQNPFPDFAEPLVAFMEANQGLAFIQTPQYYTNFEINRVAHGAGLQQAVFYEYICEGKSMQDAMFCCGTNVIFRVQALVDVGGFEESSVTEDFATSLKFHLHNWHSAYLNKICAFGLGPEDLGGYFKQQFRWALGTVGLFRTVLKNFVLHPFSLTGWKWWEYFLSGTHYFVGWVFFIMMISPILYLFLNIPSYFVNPELYFLFFCPYIILTLSLFFFTLSQRRYRLIELAQGIVLQAITFPVFMRASLLGIIGIRGSFGVTPKGSGQAMPLLFLWPQLTMAIACFAAIIWAINRIYFERTDVVPIAANAFWCFYHFCILSTALYFNNPIIKRGQKEDAS
ncbi:glycosyltransferase family 2 protein [Desulfovibrio inopinatus]|uniref:glycosyltransferase family 2 protein n=1 Tax=Desulfovibrio inopinatus TaxID=102109 RepID=UPI00040D0C19|nr:glycosyltransferase family 2 protein [Desulfovibrio inopinatus]